MGTTPSDSTTVSTSKYLRTKLFFKREGMLRTRVNPPLYFVSIFYRTHMLCKSSHQYVVLSHIHGEKVIVVKFPSYYVALSHIHGD